MLRGQFCLRDVVDSTPEHCKKERIYEKTTGKAWEAVVVSCTCINGIPAWVIQTCGKLIAVRVLY